MQVTKNNKNDLLEKIKEKFTDDQQKMFVDSFYCYLNEPKDAFVIDLNDVWTWLGFTRKDTCKKLFKKFFIEDKDYIVEKELIECQNKETAPLFGGAVSLIGNSFPLESGKLLPIKNGRPSETILMSVSTFKDLCLTSNTKKAKEVRSYFLKLEEIVFDTIKESHLKTIEIHKQIGQSDYMIKHFHMKSIVYLGNVEQNKTSQIVKYGHTSDIKGTYRRHQQSYGNEFKFLYALECKEHYKLESMIKTHNDLQTRHIKTYNEMNRQELIRLDDHFDLNKFIELINDMQVSLKCINQNEQEMSSQIKIQEETTKQEQEKTKQIEAQEKTKQEQIKKEIEQEKTKQMQLELKIIELKIRQTQQPNEQQVIANTPPQKPKICKILKEFLEKTIVYTTNPKEIINIEKSLYPLYLEYMTRNFQQPTIYIFETFSGKIKNIIPNFHKRIGKEPCRYLGIKHHTIKANYI